MVVKKSNLFKGFLSLLAIFFIITFLAACDKTIKVESISLDKEEIVLAVGDSETIVADVKPDNATDKTVSWSSEKPEIATVNDGVIEAVAVGETVITATAGEKTATVTVTVKEKYTVTFNSKGGSAVAPVQVMDGSKVTKPTDPTKLGYTFINWYSDDACENLYDFNVNVEANITLYAKWEDIKYTVTFNLDGGSEVSEQIVPYNGKAAEPAEDPIKEGHTFQGWFADAECETEFDFDAVIADDTVVYAKWQIKTFTVVFNTGGGTFIPGVEINYDSKVTRPEDPVKAEYIFRGWFKDSKHTEAFDFDQSITEDTTIFANWEFDTTNYCTLNFNVEGALFPITEIDDLMAAKPSITHELGVFNTGYMTYYKESIFLFKKGYAGNTWAREVGLARNADGLYEVIATVAAGTAISAEFKAAAEFILVGHDGYSAGFNFLNGLTVGQIITITGFDVLTAEDGKLDPKATVKVYPAGTKMQFSNVLLANDAKLPKPVKKNYAFAGWYGNADFAGEPVTKATTDATLYAKWAEVCYIFYTLDGGVNDPLNPVTYSELDFPLTLIDPTKEGYDFIGWFLDSGFSGEPLEALEGVKGNVTLYAKWEYKVTFMDDATLVLIQKVKHEGLLTRPDDLEKEGYVFLGWFVDLEDEVSFDFATLVTSDLVLYAKWGEIIPTEVDWEAQYNESLGKWYIKVTPENESLDQDTIKSIEVVMEAGELLDTPRALTPDTDSVLWFSVAGKSGLPIIKADGKYIYHVVKKDDSDYFLTFEYKNELVIGLPEPLAADIDYKAVWNGDRERWYIKVSVADELLNAASIKAISKIMEAGEYVAPVELTPDVDTVLWFSVAGKNGLPILKEAGKYMYEVTRQDDTVYVFTFDYDPEEVLDLPDIIDATVDYNAVWNATLERWFVKVSLDEDLDKDTIARIAKVMAAGEYVAPVELVPNTDTVLWFGVANIEADLAYRAAGRYLFEVERKADESVYVFGFTYNPEEVKGLEHIIEFEPKFDLQLPVVEYTLEKWLQYADPAGGNDVGASRVEGFVVIPDAYGIAELADDVKIFNGGYCAVLDADLKPKYFVDRWGRDWNATDGWVVHGADQNEAWAYGVNHFASYFKPHLGEGDLLLMASQYGKGLPGETGTYRNYLGNLLIYDLGSVTADHRGVKQEDLVNPSDVQFIIKENQIGVKDYPTYLTMRAAKGDVMTKPEDPIREGYQFVGWFTDKALTEEFDFELEVNQNYKLYPKWDLIVYEAKFQLNGGTLKIPIFQTKKEMIDAFLKDLYDFINPEDELSVFMHGVDKTEGYDGTWHSNEEYKTKIYAGPRPTEVDEAYFISSAKYMNKWLPLFDVVDKFVNGVNKDQHFYNDTFVGFLRIKVYVMSTKPWGYVSDAVYNLFPQEYLPLKYSIESAKLVLPVVEKDGCSFGGWYDNPEFTGDAWTEIPAKYHEPLEFHAKWEFLGTEIEPEVDYKAVYNEEHKTWYIKVTVPGLSLDIDTISVITVVKKAGEWLVEPIDLVPDTDTVLWFGVCKDDLDLSYKSDGEYKYIVIKKDETLYNFAFIYDHKLVDDLYDRSCAAAVDALISALPEELTPEDKADVEAARVAYDALTESQKGFIQNLAYLETKEAELAVIIAVHEPTYHLNEGERLHPVFADKTAMIEAFLSDFYDYVKPTESLTDFMHGVGKTSGYDGLWHTDTYVLQLYNNNDRESNPAKNKFINQPEYNSKWLPFFDMMEEFTVTVNSSQSFWGSIKWVGKYRIKQYIMNVKPASYVTEETMNMMPPEYLLIKYSFESDALLLPTVVREGYVFGGWYDNADFTGDAWTEIPAGYYKPLDLYAKWLMTITTVRGADVGNEVITKGIITALVGNNAFIQDDGAGIYLYLGGDASFADKLVIGNLVKVKGTRAVYNNLVQISNLADIEVLATAQELPTSVEFVDEVELADLLALQGSLVSVKGFKIKAIPTIGTGAYSVIITNDIVDITIRVDYSVAPFAELKALFSVLEIGANVDFINIPVSQYKEEVQLMLGSLDQIVIDEAIKMDVVKALLALFDGKQFDMDSSVDLPSELMGVTIEWTTDNEVIDLATGEVGTVTKDAVVNLTAKLTIGEVQDTITVVVTVKFLDPTLLYYTGFEDVTKTSYAAGDITSNDITWNLDDALIGNADNDKKVGTKSVRIKNGVVTMKSSLQQVAKLSFQYARYSKDEGTLLAVEISKDGENWVEIMPATTSPNELTEVVLEIDYESEALVTAGITAESEVRFRFVKTGTKDKRVNLDEVYIYTFS